MEDKLAAVFREWDVTKLIQDEQVKLFQLLGQPAGAVVSFLNLQLVGKVKQVKEPGLKTRSNPRVS